VKVTIAAVMMGVICRVVVIADHAVIGSASMARIADVVFGVPLGAVSFYAFAALVKAPEVAAARDELRARMLRR
jgi:hypothetical protein